ncbi:glycosyltransferase family 39 protein [Sulfuriroseicoccus oceanibius]|uniref:Glycosyltransferase family 39 protein n=1 Tax=Sulfuriroseicoccus oceanibius TaxID=2707525 RepID=A0A6B3LAI9_9BACT|nr:glycosyltransferase family 39 protein [Sulfuriroseicoccus oceanibius]QQL45930.1 glycosyltransferase family 39 protein [Sulfuriroseicoccus oceanibius]
MTTELINRFRTLQKSERFWLWCVLGALTVFFLWLQGVPEDPAKSLTAIQEKWNAGEWAKTRDYARWGTHLFAWINAGICALLALTLPLWHRRGTAPATASTKTTPRWIWIALALVVALGGALRYQTATGGLWHDELHNAQRVNGYHRFDKKDPLFGEAKFRPAKWEETAFYYRKPTNHVAFSVPSRLTHSAWQAITGADRSQLSPFFLRLPSFLAALASIFLIGWLLVRWNLPLAGLLAAIFLAIHPWAIRWSVDARSYGLTMCFILVALHAVTGIVRSGKWRWWALFGFAQSYLMWLSVQNALLILPMLAVVIGQGIAAKRRDHTPLWPLFSKIILTSGVAACLFLQVMGPNLIQLKQYTDLKPPSESDYLRVGEATLSDTASNWLIGIPFDVPVVSGDLPITTFKSRYTNPTIGWVWASLSALFTLAGIGVMLKKPATRTAGWLALGLIVSAALVVGLSAAADMFFYPRFVAYLPLPLALGMGVFWTTRPSAGRRILGAATGVLFFALLASPQISNLFQHVHEPLPQISSKLDQIETDSGVAPLAATYGLAGEVMEEMVDPDVRGISSRDEIEQLIAKSRETGRPLFICYGNQSFNRVVIPDGFDLLDNPAYFTLVQRFVSNDPRHTFFLMKYVGE